MSRTRTRFIILLLSLALLAAIAAPVIAQGDDDPPPTLDGESAAALEVRTGPGIHHTLIGLLPAGAPVIIEARSPRTEWLLLHTADGVEPALRGWVVVDGVSVADGADLQTLAESTHLAPLPGIDISGEDADDRAAAIIELLEALPVLPTVTPTTREVFAVGRADENRSPRIFTLVGDCHTESVNFLKPFGRGEYDLGSYDDLQTTIDYFGGVAIVTEQIENVFTHHSLATASAFSAGAVLDPLWAHPEFCQPEETPLACEYRRVQPSFALILVGAKDIFYYSLADFRANMTQVIEQSIAEHVVPILGTFPIGETHRFYMQSLEFNAIIADLAAAYDVPLINYWQGMRDLPGWGLYEDAIHVVEPPEDQAVLAFNGDELRYGMVMRNLITLQALDALRVELLQPYEEAQQ